MAMPKFSDIRVIYRLTMLGIIALAMCAVPTYIFVRAAYKEIRTSEHERSGLAPTSAIVRVMQPLQNHRGLAAAVLSGDQALVTKRGAMGKEVTEAFTKVRAALPASATTVITLLDAAETEWKSLSTALKDRSYPVEDSYNRHSKLIAQLLRLLEANIDYFGLSLDPEADTYHMVIAAYVDLPKLTEAMGRLRATGTSILGIKQATTEERVTIASMLERTREELAHSESKINKAIEANGAPMDALLAAMKKAQNETQKLIGVTDLEFMRIEVLRYEPAAYLNLATTAIDAQFAVIDAARVEIERELGERIAALWKSMIALLCLVVVMLLFGTLMMVWIARSIIRPLNEAVADADGIAAGHLDLVIKNIGLDEVGKLRRSMRHMQRNLAHIVFSIRESSESVATAAEQIASSTRDMSARTEEQASSLEETAASMEEMNSTVQQNDASSQQANELASGAAQAAERGGAVVNKVANTMQEINTSSKQIAEIIGVIDSIAFQTNILALNAAVEAARAGEQGRGFAVVATEVRALAQRSGQASKEIRTLIGESVKKIQAGTREALEAGEAMEEILGAARKVEATMRQIRTASQDQRQGISQVSGAVEQMNQGTQQSAAMVEEIAATADMLRGQAHDLIQAVSAFKLSGLDGQDEAGSRGQHNARRNYESPMPKTAAEQESTHRYAQAPADDFAIHDIGESLPGGPAQPMLPRQNRR